MGGFRKELNNAVFKNSLFKLIIIHISKCCEKLKNDCLETGEYLYNHEDKISSRLVERYLDVGFSGLRFNLQKPEHFDAKTDTYKGRTDITVISFDWFVHSNAYYVIECKRLDGKCRLNKEYVSEGIARFIESTSPLYPSYYGKSIMLGYIVQAINVSENAKKIDKLQRELLVDVMIGEMRTVCDGRSGFSYYRCVYQSYGKTNVELAHLFYDFSDVIMDKS